MKIRTVTIELLRAGPRHNQLVSPLTPYLGVCGNSPASQVTLPYEHGELERRLRELRYAVTDDEDGARAAEVLEQTGREMAQILARIDGVAGTLNPQEGSPQTLTHLRIVLSASELAMLPLEAAKVPTGAVPGSTWLALQARTPVCITRHIRSVSGDGVPWPRTPRVLFLAGPDTPLDEHQRALREVMAPWRDADGSVDPLLTVLRCPCMADVTAALSAAAHEHRPFTHVHVLAHGAALDEGDRHSAVGLQLAAAAVEPPVSGPRLASALTSVADAGSPPPAVVTLASCDGGRVADPRSSNASIAHDLHDRGIPLVVASQFPLSVAGSIPFVRRFYAGQLDGEHPLVSMYALRLELHSRLGAQSHDWASLVVYEALPGDLRSQLEDLCYWQARRALDCALKRLESTPLSAGAEAQRRLALQDIDRRGQRLPGQGPYALECSGLRAAAHKRIAEDAFRRAAQRGDAGPESDALMTECGRRLDEARSIYWCATKAFLSSSSEPLRRKSNLHWLLGQVIWIDVMLDRPLDPRQLAAARFAAQIDTGSAGEDERAWARVSELDFALLSLSERTLALPKRREIARDALALARAIVEAVGRGGEQVATTRRQVRRYVEVWGNRGHQRLLQRLGIPPRPHWHERCGLVPTAREVLAVFGPDPDGPPAAAVGDGDAPAAAAPAQATGRRPARVRRRQDRSAAR